MCKHILFFDCNSQWGGQEYVASKQAQRLLAEGYQVSLVCHAHSPFLSTMRVPGVETIGLDMGEQITDYSGRSNKWRLARDYVDLTLRLHKTLRDLHPSLVYALGSRSAKSVLPAVILQSLPFCWSVHNQYPVGGLDRILLWRSDAVICVSDAVRRHFVPVATDQRKLYVVYNSINVSAYASADGSGIRHELGLESDDLLLGLVGRISLAKGQLEFVRTVIPLMEEVEQLHVAIVGQPVEADQGYLQRIQELIWNSPAYARFHLMGWRVDIQRIMRSLDLLVLPSLHEAFGIVLVEGMAAGKPVIAYAVGGVPEIVVDGVSGCLIPPGDVTRLMRTVRRLLSHPEERERLGRTGQARAYDMFDEEKLLGNFVRIVRQILE